MACKQLWSVLGVALVVLYLTVTCKACFITNCPPGGKRSTGFGLLTNSLRRECTRCGPALSGRCFGPDICCSPLLGCNVGGAVSTRCALETMHGQLCANPGPVCANGKGVCALNSTCCTNHGCFMDNTCTSHSFSLDTLSQENTF